MSRSTARHADGRSTLPSSLETPRFSAEELAPPLPTGDTPTAPSRTSALSPAYPTGRPALRHANSSTGNVESPSQSGRNRSGSLTLPKNGIGNAFGSSVFSNAWLANPGQSRTPLGHLTHDDDPNSSILSDSAASIDLNFSTLDYLGLEEGNDLPPASMSELRNQAQRAIANSGPASRLRASTVSNFARPFRPSVVGGYSREQYEQEPGEDLAGQMAEMGIYDNDDIYAGGNYGYAQAAKDPHRPRATTIGGLDGRRNLAGGYLSSIPQSPVQANMFSSGLKANYGYPPRTRAGTDAGRSRDSSATRGPRMSFSSQTSRAPTPDIAGSSTPQVPTRSLWIGNLDVGATSAALLHVFAPYGAIESVRMLPEKVSYPKLRAADIIRHALSSTLWKRVMPFEPETTSSTAWEVMSPPCQRLLPCVLDSARLILSLPTARATDRPRLNRQVCIPIAPMVQVEPSLLPRPFHPYHPSRPRLRTRP